MDRFLMKDRNEILPASVSIHVIFCKECRTAVRRMTLAEKSAAAPLSSSVPLDDKTLAAVMQQVAAIERSEDRKPETVSLLGWVAAGIFMIAAMMLFGVYTTPGHQVLLTIPFYLIFAAAIVGYCLAFVCRNMDFFVKKIGLNKPATSTN